MNKTRRHTNCPYGNKKKLTVRRSVTFGGAAHQHTFLERTEVQQRARVVRVRGGGGRGRGRRLRRRGGGCALALAFSLWLFRLCADRGDDGEWRSAGAPSRGDHRDATGVEQPSRGGQRPGERRGYRGNSGCAMCARRCETLEANTSSDRSISSPSKTSIEERFVTPPRCDSPFATSHAHSNIFASCAQSVISSLYVSFSSNPKRVYALPTALIEPTTTADRR